jgi:hypothetical protein
MRGSRAVLLSGVIAIAAAGGFEANRLMSGVPTAAVAADATVVADSDPALPSVVDVSPEALHNMNLHFAKAEIRPVLQTITAPGIVTFNDLCCATQPTSARQASGLMWRSGLVQPIFDGGTLRHRERAAKATFDMSTAQYRAALVTAFQNVADVLVALQTDAAALKAAVASEQTASRSLDIARSQLKLGYVSYLSVLNAEQTYQITKLALAQAQAKRLTDTAALFQALGAGWWNRNDAAPAASNS